MINGISHQHVLSYNSKKLMFADLYNKYPPGDFYVVNMQENTFIKEDCI